MDPTNKVGPSQVAVNFCWFVYQAGESSHKGERLLTKRTKHLIQCMEVNLKWTSSTIRSFQRFV